MVVVAYGHGEFEVLLTPTELVKVHAPQKCLQLSVDPHTSWNLLNSVCLSPQEVGRRQPGKSLPQEDVSRHSGKSLSQEDVSRQPGKSVSSGSWQRTVR